LTKDLLGIGFDMLFFELYKIMVNKVTFAGFGGGGHCNRLPGSATASKYQYAASFELKHVCVHFCSFLWQVKDNEVAHIFCSKVGLDLWK